MMTTMTMLETLTMTIYNYGNEDDDDEDDDELMTVMVIMTNGDDDGRWKLSISQR